MTSMNMRRWHSCRPVSYLAAIVGAISLLIGLGCAAATSAETTTDSAVKSTQLSEFMQQFAASRPFSGSIMVTQRGETLLRTSYGMANVELSVPNTPETRFRIGSVSKQFTAMAILILAERGRFKLDDRLVDLVPGLPQTWSGVRVFHLLNHTSGIMHSWDLPGFEERVMTPFPVAEMIEAIKDKPLLFEPGADFQYSGIGYFLLANIIERTSGQSYEDFLKREIFEPLGMRDSGEDHPERIIPLRASGYTSVGGTLQNAKTIYMPNLIGGGDLYSTVSDLSSWDQALAAGKLISAESYRAMFTPGRNDYGYGWKILHSNGHQVIEHSGGVNGFRAYIRRLPQQQVGIFILTNVYNVEETAQPQYKMEEIYTGMERILLGGR